MEPSDPGKCRSWVYGRKNFKTALAGLGG